MCERLTELLLINFLDFNFSWKIIKKKCKFRLKRQKIDAHIFNDSIKNMSDSPSSIVNTFSNHEKIG